MVALDAVRAACQLLAHRVPYLTRHRLAVILLHHLQESVGHCVTSAAGQTGHSQLRGVGANTPQATQMGQLLP
jgi:hypothetical protein